MTQPSRRDKSRFAKISRKARIVISDAWSSISLAIGLISGIASLAGFPAGTSRIILSLTAVTFGLVVVVRIWSHTFLRRNRELKKRVAEQEHIVEAIKRVVDREKSTFREELELTIIAGKDDTDDRVIESRRTMPTHPITHRALRPIVQSGRGARPITLAELGYTVRLDRQPNGTKLFSLLEDVGEQLVWLVFDHALTTEIEWEVRYRSPGLLRPLREKGRDQLRWRDRLLTEKSGPSVLSTFTVNFVFPDSEEPPRVLETQNRGTFEPVKRDPTGWLIRWTDPNPQGHIYEWDLFQRI